MNDQTPISHGCHLPRINKTILEINALIVLHKWDPKTHEDPHLMALAKALLTHFDHSFQIGELRCDQLTAAAVSPELVNEKNNIQPEPQINMNSV